MFKRWEGGHDDGCTHFFYIHVPRPCVRLISYFSFSLGEAQRFAFCCSLATYSSLQRVPDGTNGSHTHNQELTGLSFMSSTNQKKQPGILFLDEVLCNIPFRDDVIKRFRLRIFFKGPLGFV